MLADVLMRCDPESEPVLVEAGVSPRGRVSRATPAPWGEFQYVVLGNTAVTPVIREVRLAPLDSPLVYRPGQYVLLGDAQRQVPQRSYSIADAPSQDGGISLLVTKVPGGPTSTWVHETLRTGDQVIVEGPYGTFMVDDKMAGPLLLLGAGSGLAPIRAIAEAALRERPDRDITLFFSARTERDLIDEPDLLQWARDDRSFRYLRTLTRSAVAATTGRIPGLLPQLIDMAGDCQVFIAGPPGFVVDCAHAAVALGADPAYVHTEEFFQDPQPWSGSPPAQELRVGRQ